MHRQMVEDCVERSGACPRPDLITLVVQQQRVDPAAVQRESCRDAGGQ
jgi:hypothetical protein